MRLAPMLVAYFVFSRIVESWIGKPPLLPLWATPHALQSSGCYSARSIFAEAIMNKEGAGRFCAFSAGNMPGAAPNPLTIAQLRDLGHDVSGLHWKSVAVF